MYYANRYHLQCVAQLLLIAAYVWIGPDRAAAQQVSWDGGGDGTSWSDAANWDSDAVPTSSDMVVITHNPGSDYVIVLASTATVKSLELATTRATLDLQAMLAVSETVDFRGGSITGAADLIVGGSLTWSQGTLSGSGRTEANGGLSITGGSGNAKLLDGRRLILASGQTALHTGLSFFGSNGGVLEIESGATFELGGDNNYRRFAIAGESTTRPRIINAGIFKKTSGTTYRVDVEWDIENSGTVELNLANAHLRFGGAITDSGGTYRASAGRLDFYPFGESVTFGTSSTIEGAGTIEFSGGDISIGGIFNATGVTEVSGGGNEGATVDIASTATLTSLGEELLIVHDRGTLSVATTDPLLVGRLEQDFQGVLYLSSPLTVAGNYVLGNASARLESAFDVTVQGQISWKGGTISGPGTLFAGGGLVTSGGPGSASWVKHLDQKRLVIPSGQTATHGGAYFTGSNGAVLEIQTDAVFEVTESYRSFEVGDGSPPVIENVGTFRKPGGSTSTTYVRWDAINSGTIEVDHAESHLRMSGSLTDQGGRYLATAGILELSMPPQSEAYSFTSGSLFRVLAGATINFGAEYSADQTTSVEIHGTFDSEGTTSVRGANNLSTVTIVASANLLNLGAEHLIVGGNRGALDVQVTDPLTVGDLTIGFQGTLTLASDLAVTGDYVHTNATSRLESDFDVSVSGSLTWDGGTMTGQGSTVVSGGLNVYGTAGSASNVKRLDGRNLIVAGGDGVFDGQLLYGGNGAILEIGREARWDIDPSRGDWSTMNVLENSTADPIFRNAGVIYSATGGGLRTDWQLENNGIIDLGAGTLVVEPLAGLLNAGTIRGIGNITGDVHNSGVVSPGTSAQPAGMLDVVGIFTQAEAGSTVVDITGSAAGSDYDVVEAAGVELDGTLRLRPADGYVPGSTDVYQVVRWPGGTRNGSFATVAGQDAGEVFLALRYADESVEVFDGSLPDPPPSPQIGVNVDSPPYQRRNRAVPGRVKVTNSGGASVMRLRVTNIKIGLPPYGSACPTDDAYENVRCRMERFGVTPPPPGEGESYPFLAQVGFPGSISGGGGGDGSTLSGSFAGEGALEFGGSQTCDQNSIQMAVQAGAPVTDDDLSGCAYAVAKLALDFVPGYGCFKLATGIGTAIGEGVHAGEFDLTGYLAANMVGAVNCAGDAVPATKAIKIMLTLNDLASKAGGIQGVSDACGNAAGQQTASASGASSTTCIASSDPNEKVGPPGTGIKRYVAPQDTLPYVVFFENKEDATAPAQVVEIADTLDLSVLDLNTFSFGMIAWGDTSISMPGGELAVTKDVDLRPNQDLIVRIEGEVDSASGVLSWTFTSLDPATMEVTTDPLAGFLPPNQTPPEGEGLVSYYIEPFDTLDAAVTFGNPARIFFDDNAPIDTPTWENSIDAAAPTSSVAELDPVQTTTEFSVRWTGDDAGSGVQSYTVFVSVNGGDFAEWLTATADTTATFTASDGESYAFYSAATDSVGNTESKAAEAEATTTVDLSVVSAGEDQLPDAFALMEPFPNPFSGHVTLEYALPEPSLVRVEVYDALGRLVKTVVDARQAAGRYSKQLSARDLASGTYVCVMKAGSFRASRPIVVVK